MEPIISKKIIKGGNISITKKLLTVIDFNQENLKTYTSNLFDDMFFKNTFLVNSGKFRRGRPQILLVGGESYMLDLSNNYRSMDCEIVIRHDPASAFMWINEGNLPVLIVCQLNLPHFRTLSFIRVIRSISFCKHTPFIILSGENGLQDKLNHSQLLLVTLVSEQLSPLALVVYIQNALKKQSLPTLKNFDPRIWPNLRLNSFLILAILTIVGCVRYNIINRTGVNSNKHILPQPEFKKLSQREQDNPFRKSVVILSTAD